MVLEVRGAGGMGALLAEDMQFEKDEHGQIITAEEDAGGFASEDEEDESDFDDNDLADFDDDTMRELERKRRARAQEAAEHRKELRRKSQELGAEKAKAHEKE